MLARTRLALLVTTLSALAGGASAHAATVVGSSLAASPAASCVTGGLSPAAECTLTQLDPPTYASPVAGVITRWSLKHGAELGVTIPAAELRILTPGAGASTFTARRADVQASMLSGGAATDTFSFTDDAGRPRGVPIAQGERIGVYVNDAALDVLGAASAQAGFVRGSHGSGSQDYDAIPSTELLLQAVVEPDADGDGYGDETQDACPAVAGPAACPSPDPGSGGVAGPGDGGPAGPGGGGPGITPYVAKNIEGFHAETITVYRAAEIKRLPATTNLHDAVMRGFSQPIRCSLACRITAAATMRGISASLYAMMSRTRTIKIGASAGRFPSAGHGKLRIKLTPKARKALNRYGRTVRVTVRTTVKDGRKTVTRTQTITLRAKRSDQARAALPSVGA